MPSVPLLWVLAGVTAGDGSLSAPGARAGRAAAQGQGTAAAERDSASSGAVPAPLSLEAAAGEDVWLCSHRAEWALLLQGQFPTAPSQIPAVCATATAHLAGV